MTDIEPTWEQIYSVPRDWSGIYQFYDANDQILYVGQSVSLFKRLIDHFSCLEASYFAKMFNQVAYLIDPTALDEQQMRSLLQFSIIFSMYQPIDINIHLVKRICLTPIDQPEQIDQTEKQLIATLKPPYNRESHHRGYYAIKRLMKRLTRSISAETKARFHPTLGIYHAHEFVGITVRTVVRCYVFLDPQPQEMRKDFESLFHLKILGDPDYESHPMRNCNRDLGKEKESQVVIVPEKDKLGPFPDSNVIEVSKTLDALPTTWEDWSDGSETKRAQPTRPRIRRRQDKGSLDQYCKKGAQKVEPLDLSKIDLGAVWQRLPPTEGFQLEVS